MPTSRHPTWTIERAFTLVEMLVVLVIVSIGFGMVVFALTDRPADWALEHEAAAVADWVRTMPVTAQTQGQAWVIRYDLDHGTLRARPAGSSESDFVVDYKVAAPVHIEQVEVAGELAETRTYGVVQVAVSADGRCAPHMVVLGQEGVGARTLEVNPVTSDVAEFPDAREYKVVAVSDLVGER